jgi:hypothetical protein
MRPAFLRDRGRISTMGDNRDVAVVFLNDQFYGPLDGLRSVSAGTLQEIRYFSGTDAVVRFGSQFGGGVIQLISRKQ